MRGRSERGRSASGFRDAEKAGARTGVAVVIRVAMLMLLTSVGGAAQGLPATAYTRSEEPCVDPADPCVEELLEMFQPHLFFENAGPSGFRVEYPVAFTGGR
jgi:hypothetical protein